jgi:imidazoleglycerol-phosphate dehydratase / histidinol-phosphatase
MAKAVLFIDRDGTIVHEPADEQVDSLEKLAFLPKVFRNLYRLQRKFELAMVTNQDGLGTPSFPTDTFWPTHNKMMQTLEGEGIQFAGIHIDEHFPKDKHPNRKPGTGMLTGYINNSHYDIARSFVIGDRLTDVELAKNLGCKGIFIAPKADGWTRVVQAGLESHCALVSDDWDEMGDFLMNAQRTASISRQTKETSIHISLDIDGKGHYKHETGIGFFDHMLDQLAKHSGIDIHIHAQGDLHIDTHHTIEDVGLALGAAFAEALGNKAGMERYGFAILPMDEALAQVAIDFSGRPWLVWEDQLKGERVGEMPTELCEHFFKSFSDTAKCNLNMRVSGKNDHHQIEILFKAFAKAVRMAVRRQGNEIPSTKGVI